MTIKATILADSIYNGHRITSFELELPRWIWAEMLTHRLFSRNAASSRAIPVKATAKQIKSSPAQPTEFGANKPGMQSSDQLSGTRLYLAKKAWNLSAYLAATSSQLLSKLGVHKQWANRVSEYAQTYKVVLTATEFDNFFHLRRHADAQPEIRQLADAMYEAMSDCTPMELQESQWHLPYITRKRTALGDIEYYNSSDERLTIDEAVQVSASCCAQVSYRLLNDDITKAKDIYSKLVDSTPVHASPFEHQASPIEVGSSVYTDGVTHLDSTGNLWSGNFCGWIQHRHLLPGNTCTEYVPHV